MTTRRHRSQHREAAGTAAPHRDTSQGSRAAPHRNADMADTQESGAWNATRDKTARLRARVRALRRRRAWMVSQGGYACGWMARVHGARECSCAVVHIVTHSFSERGETARRSPSDCHTLTLRVDAPNARGPHIHPHTTESLFPGLRRWNSRLTARNN